MKSKYSKLFMDIDKLITKDAKSLQDWINLKIMFKFLEGHIKMMINKESRKATHFKKKVADVEPVKKSEYDQDMEEDKEEDKEERVEDFQKNKKNGDNYFGRKMDDLEEEKIEQHPIYKDTIMQRCNICNKYITPADEKKQNV
jgi:formylmethanofuran dehydrogenase subunit E